MSPRVKVALLTFSLMLLVPNAAFAWYRSPVPIQSGFQHTPNLQADDTPPGLALDGASIIRGSTTIADIDGNPQNGKEIVVGGKDGLLYAYRSNGSRLWQQRVANCNPGNDDLIHNAPAVADVNGDGRPDVVIGYGTTNNACQGGVSVYDGLSGNRLWNFSVPPDPNFPNVGSGVLATPAVGNIDDGSEVVVGFGSNNGYFHVLNRDGSLRWRYLAQDTMRSSPAFADLNGDGRKEIIFGTDFTPGLVCNPANPNQPRNETALGFLYAFPANPTFTPDPVCARDGGTTIGFDKGYLWKVPLDQTISSSPAVGDIDGDGALEVVVGASCYYRGSGNWVKIFSGTNGALERTLNAPNCVASSPAIGDVNGDGKLDVIANVGNGFPGVDPTPPITGQPTNPGTGPGQVAAWSFDNPNPLWIVTPKGATGETAGLFEDTNNPVLADLDGNGSIEVALVVQNSVTVLRGNDGAQLTTQSLACNPNNLTGECAKKSMFMWLPNRTTPAIADIDNDGKLELVVGGSHTSSGNPAFQNRAFLYVWRDFATFLGSPQGAATPYSAPWPQFKGNAALTGSFAPRRLAASVASLNALVTPQRSVSFNVQLGSSDGSNFNWTASENDPDNVVRLSATSGNTTSPLVVTVSTDSTKAEQRKRSTASITLRAEGLGEVTIPVTVVSGPNAVDSRLPLVRR